jgi:hypothetical protein
MPELLLFPVELRRFLEEPRTASIVPAAIIVPILSLWPYFASPWVPALAATIACVEPYFLNMWCLWPGQLESLALRPINWHRAIAVKNFTAFCITVLVFLLFAVVTYYAHSGAVDGPEFFFAFQDCLFAGVVLAMFGNNYSIVSPRPGIGWTLSDMAGSILALIIAGTAMIPVVVLSYLIGSWIAHSAALTAAVICWYLWSVPAAASHLAHTVPETWIHTIAS